MAREQEMKQTRKKHNAAFKAKVALAAVMRSSEPMPGRCVVVALRHAVSRAGAEFWLPPVDFWSRVNPSQAANRVRLGSSPPPAQVLYSRWRQSDRARDRNQPPRDRVCLRAPVDLGIQL